VHPIVLVKDGDGIPIAVAGGAGDAALVKQAYVLCDKILKELALKEWGGKTPSFKQFRDAVRRIEGLLISRFRELRQQGIEPEFRMILASVSPEGEVSIYLFDDRGLAEPVHDNPGFAVIGRGFYTGGNLLLRLLGYTPEESHEMDLGALSAFIIDVVSEVDPTVGPFVGESYYMRVKDGKVLLGPLKEEAIKEYKEKVKRRKELIRRIWRLLDIAGEEVLKMIEELEALKRT